MGTFASLRLSPAVEDSFRQVVLEHQAPVRAYLRRRVADPARAEDLTQEVFLRAWRSAATFDAARGEVRGWLLGIARNLVVDAHRAEAVRQRLITSEEVLAAESVADGTDDAVAAWAMADALGRLTAAHRDVLVCLYYRRWSIAQTAAHLGIPNGTVKSRSTYALRALKLVLDEQEDV